MALALEKAFAARIKERPRRLCTSGRRTNMLLWVLLLTGAGRAFEPEEHTGIGGFFAGANSHWVHVQKCCPETHMMVEVTKDPSTITGSQQPGTKFECQEQNDTNFRWAPDYLDEHENVMPFEASVEQIEANSSEGDFNITKFCLHQGPCISAIVGKPQCGPVRAWPIFTYAGFQEDLQLRPFGVLRHIVDKWGNNPHQFEYPLDQYCVDGVKLLGSVSHFGHGLPHGAENDTGVPPPPADGPIFYALICEPGPLVEADFFELFVRVFYPIGLACGLLVLLLLAGVHLALKELRDLSGCMLVSLIVSMIVTMAGNLILSATDSRPSLYLNLFFLESIVHGADIAIHFWLNAIGHRAWAAIRHPRKEAMRPEGRRLLYYSIYAWGLAASVTCLAGVVHLFIDEQPGSSTTSPHSFFTWYKIGWLGLALFCTTSVLLFLVNIYLYFTTRTNLSHQTAYGRTFHRNKGYFRAFTRLFLIVETVWIIQTFSWLQYPILVGLRVLADITLPFLILWAALKGRRVMHLLKIRLQMSQCWLCRRCFPPKNRERVNYYGEEMMALGTPI